MASDSASVAKEASPEAPAALRLPQVAWDMLSPLLQCPQCGSANLSLKPDAVVCGGCNARFAVENATIDFIGARAGEETPPFYANPYYRRFIDSLSKIHEAHYEAGSFSDRIEQGIKADLFKLVEPSNEPAIDLGCGLGECFPRMGAEDRIVGVDFSMELLTETRRRYPKAALMRADFAALPFRDKSLKRVFSIAVLEHVFWIERAMRHMQRCLAPDGRFYVAVPTEGGLGVATARIVTSARNAKLIGLTPEQSRIAQRRDHCNTVFLIENNLRKFFEIEATRTWPFPIGGVHANLSKAYRLKALVPQ